MGDKTESAPEMTPELNVVVPQKALQEVEEEEEEKQRRIPVVPGIIKKHGFFGIVRAAMGAKNLKGTLPMLHDIAISEFDSDLETLVHRIGEKWLSKVRGKKKKKNG